MPSTTRPILRWLAALCVAAGVLWVRSHWVADTVVYTRPSGAPASVTLWSSSGYLALQAETAPIEFRKVELLNLSGCMDPKSSKYRSYYVHADDAACR